MTTYDVFISYAWSDPRTQTFAHDLAAQLHLVGFNVGIDIDQDYGSSLSGFMGQIAESKHVLLILDRDYLHRADTMPDSGVGIENAILRSVIDDKPNSWLSVAFVNQNELPKWLAGRKPKGFRFDLEGDRRYGSSQLEDLWRWLAGLPADKSNSASPSVIRERMARLERIDNLRDPSRYSNPNVEGRARNVYPSAPRNTFAIGYGDFEFKFTCTEAGGDSVYLYNDYVHSVGLLPPELPYEEVEASIASEYLVPGRTVTLRPGAQFAILNKNGIICTGIVHAVENYRDPYKEKDNYVEFSYRIIVDG